MRTRRGLNEAEVVDDVEKRGGRRKEKKGRK